MIEVSTSLLNVEEDNVLKTIYELETALTDYFHIDVMDGRFVEKNTTEKMLKYSTIIKQVSNIPLDVHLMVEDIYKYIDEFLVFEPRIITFHIEAAEKPTEIIQYIKEHNCNVGISIKPNTPIEDIKEYLQYVHMVLIMTVEPGLGGQKLIPETIDKIQEIKDLGLDIDIEVDGGITEETMNLVKDAGANIMVVGTAIINSENIKETIKKFQSF